ncbi:MAG: autotransporter outer membrane beta-barrel domain-containing protein [Desulfuromonadales bacterium]|nr:autotransporter outer membrane beta-barrel domain-containing protein [Desulfuromonadales bacterium]
MNKIFKTIWNETLGAWMAVAEITKAHGKGRRGKLAVAAILAATLGLSFSSAAYADLTIDTSNANTPYSVNGTSLNLAGGSLYVGNPNTGELDITNGGAVSSSLSYVGYTSGSTGTVTVNGAGSTWTDSSYIFIGESGTGTLAISGGGVVSTGAYGLGAIIGDQSGSTGTVTVDGSGSILKSTGSLTIGSNGTGTLTISNGGVVSLNDPNPGNNVAYIGRNSGSQGTVTVDGWGSEWNSTGTLNVGFNGSGSGLLNITNGGAVNFDSEVNIGGASYSPTGTGTVNVDGNNSRLTIVGGPSGSSGALVVGDGGTGTLNVTHGGVVSNVVGTIGMNNDTGTVTVDGTGSTWTNSDSLVVGRQGDGTLNILNGGYVSSIQNYAATPAGSIGRFVGGTGTVTVDGAGSTWTNSGQLIIGHQGDGTLTISNGGSVTSGGGSFTNDGILGYWAGANGTVMVDGTNSTWTNSDQLIVGYQGTGTLAISNGGSVANSNGIIGYVTGGDGTVTVSGPSSQWINNGYLVVGWQGPGALTISDSGTVNASGTTYVGQAGGVSGVVNIGAADGSVPVAPGTLNTPTVAIDTIGQLVFNHTDNTGTYFFTPQLTGPGSVLHDAGFTTLTALGSDVGSVDVKGGTLALAQAGVFSTIGNYTTETGATTALTTASTTLNVGGEFTQASGSNLNVVLGTGMLPDTNPGFTPDITAVNASLAGNLTVSNLDDSTLPTSITAANTTNGLYAAYNLIHTTGSATDGITGNFDSVSPITTNGAQALPDYLVLGSGLTNNNNDYDIGYQLAWFSGTTTGNGIFTVNPYNGGVTSFEVGVPLTDQAASATGWDGTSLTKNGTGTLILSAANTYTGATTINTGTLQTGIADTIIDSSQVTINALGTLDLNNYDQQINNLTGTGIVTNTGTTPTTLTENNATAADSTTFEGTITGPVALDKIGAGTLTLTGANSYTGPTNINEGSLYVNGNQAAATGPTTVESGATLGGIGTIGGDVALNNGSILSPGAAAGSAPGTLTIGGNLTVNSGSTLNYQFGAANIVGGPSNDLTVVGGNLTLDGGTLNVAQTEGGSFTPGIYRVINYGGTLTNSGGLNLGTMPAGNTTDYIVQTSVNNQVNLIYTAGMGFGYWDGDPASSGTGGIGVPNDGTIQGGNGIWNANQSNNNWTNSDGSLNGAYPNPSFAVFQGQAGTVTVDNSDGQVISAGMSFGTNGYLINGGPLELASGSNVIQVGDGATDGAEYVATISAQLTGDGGINKTDLGTLVLTNANTYTGGTIISGGTLTMDGANALLGGQVAGAPGTTLNLNNGGTWNVTQNSIVGTLASNAGHINFGQPPTNSSNPADYTTIQTTAFNGSNGSTMSMNTNIAANTGDLITTQTTSGSYAITINNTGGNIKGKALPLELINVSNPTASTGNYTLTNGPLEMGLYNYNLLSGKQMNLLPSDAANWYLAPSYGNLLTSILGASDQASGWIINDTLLQRMGELRATDYKQATHGMQSWVRGYGWQARVNTNDSQVNYKSTVYGFDAGTDRTWQFQNSRLSTGLFAGMNYDKRQIGSNQGHDNIDTIYGGIYGTWENNKGYYLDAVGKGGYLDTEINSNDSYHSTAKYNNWGILGSLELGKKIKSEKGWYIEPQVQGTYVHFTKASYTTSGNVVNVEQRASDSYDIRAGIVAGKTITTERAGTIQPYIKGMYGQTWTNGGDINIDGGNFKANSAGDRYQVGGGITWQVTGDKQFYADYEYIKGSRIEVPWKVNAGFRCVW